MDSQGTAIGFQVQVSHAGNIHIHIDIPRQEVSAAVLQIDDPGRRYAEADAALSSDIAFITPIKAYPGISRGVVLYDQFQIGEAGADYEHYQRQNQDKEISHE
jgi:hypothetical protein